MSKIKFGWVMPSFPVDGSDSSEFLSQIYRNLAEIEHDFDSIWIQDHFLPWIEGPYQSAPLPEAWTTLTFLAARFEDFSFGTNVLCNLYRNPSLVAKMGATLNALTNGRFILGIGAGWKEDEFKAYGFDFPKASLRVKKLEEAIRIIKRMWTGEAATFQGKWYQIEEAYCTPTPDAPPPIMIGGVGEKLMLKVIAKHADWWSCMSDALDVYERKIEILTEYCGQVGRKIEDIKLVGNMYVLVANRKQTAAKALNRNPFCSILKKSGGSRGFAYGTPDDLIRKFEELVDLGIEYFTIRFIDFPDLEGVRLFCEQVIPSLR
jgi:alkanesulfonate monooxygenase SsuD/methylene tetrahydromethanopterin reductase-like flavin-dependent oxidoreductase (luciferase family)